jgi:Ca2+-binding EF-hand superfamily protein
MTLQLSINPFLRIAWAGICAGVMAAPAFAQYTDRYQAMDDNNDGVISRSEWRGSDQSFRRHDWNNDGVLSGDEVSNGWRRRDNGNYGNERRGEPSDWTAPAFDRLDDNRDGRISRQEWGYSDDAFRRADRNNDGVLSQREFLGEEGFDRNPANRFDALDLNHDGRVSRREWTGSSETFAWLDRDNDGVLTRYEVVGSNNGTTTRNAVADTRAYRAGQERGLADGRKAGREDKTRRNAWDLDGQRELEQADAGYDAGLGPRDDYQAGYRNGFVRGYHEGFGPR